MTSFQKLYVKNLYILRFTVIWLLISVLVVFFIFLDIYFSIPFPIISIPIFIFLCGAFSLWRYKIKMRKFRYSGEFVAVVEKLCSYFEMKVPDVYRKDVKYVGALAFGSGPTAGIILTDELFEFKDKKMMKGVIAHELAHIKNNHSIQLITIIALLVGILFVTLLSFIQIKGLFFVGLVFQSLLATFVYMIFHRYFEKQADDLAKSVPECREGLKNFLLEYKEKYKKKGINVENPSLIKRLMSLHPPFEKRIKNLE